MHDVEKVKSSGLFTNYIYKAIPLAFDESLSYYETLAGLLAYIKDSLIPAINNNAQVVIELQNLYIDLKNYVDHYFDSLDLQQEVNNKLDEMARLGELAVIIDAYLQYGTTKNYNTYTDLENDFPNLVLNEKVKTLGYHQKNDGGQAEYYVTDTLNQDIYQINITGSNPQLYLNYVYKKDRTIPVKVFGYQNNDDISDLFNADKNNFYETLIFDKDVLYKINPSSITLNTNTIKNKKLKGNHSTIKLENQTTSLKFEKCELNNLIIDSEINNNIDIDIITLNDNNNFKKCEFKTLNNNTTPDLLTLVRQNKGSNNFINCIFNNLSTSSDNTTILLNLFTNQDISLNYKTYINNCKFINGKDAIFYEDQTNYEKYSSIVCNSIFENQTQYLANINSNNNILTNLKSNSNNNANTLININSNTKNNYVECISNNQNNGYFNNQDDKILNKIGTLGNLTTTNKTNLVNAVNEINSNTVSNYNKIGNLPSLNTTNKTNLVNAVNEVNSKTEYSLTWNGAEVKCGYKLNGKEVYTKCFSTKDVLSKESPIIINHGVTNPDLIWIDTSNTFMRGNNNLTQTLPLPSYNLDPLVNMNISVNNTEIKLQSLKENDPWDGYYTKYITIKYTKS